MDRTQNLTLTAKEQKV